MSDPRVFLGWDGPCLPRAAAWLRERYTRGESCDMSGVILALPGKRAGRRLLELLAEGGGILVPPRIVTTGSLPELLFTPDGPVAAALPALLARTFALRSAPRDILEAIVPRPPDDHDLLGWLTLATDLGKMHEDLAGEGVSIEHVIAHGQKQVEFNDEPRWLALARLHAFYMDTLAVRGLRDRHAARAAAIDQQACSTEHDIILIVATDLPLNTRRMLRLVRDRVTPLIHAPRDEAESFDDLGCLVAHKWSDRTIDVPDEIIHIVDRPRDQAMQSLHIVGTLGADHAADLITLGVGDETMTPMLRRSLDLAGLPAHAPVGKPVTQSRPALLLAGLAQFIDKQRLDDFAAALRHPDLEVFLQSVLDRPAPEPPPASTSRGGGKGKGKRGVSDDAPLFASIASQAVEHWLILLDDYVNEHLLARSVGQWLGDETRAARLKAVYDTVHALLPPTPQLRRPLPNWSEAIAAILAKVYAGVSLADHRPEDADLLRAIEAIGDILREQAALDPADELTPKISFADAIRFTLARLEELETPDATEPSSAAIELLGWLELQLDDAPALIITGFNEHHIPQSGGPDAFIPQSLRHGLGLMDNHRRYARDAAALTAILHSRPSIAIIAGRRGHDDEPLKPSRLLLTGDAASLANRILRFYPKDPTEEAPPRPDALLPVGGVNRFLIPAPVPPAQPIERLPVSAFRTYLDCPYRFYLKYVKRIEAMDDYAIELDALHFGNLAHEVLGAFGQSDLSNSRDESTIAGYLHDRLAMIVGERFGDQPPVAVALQVLQLRERLERFARWQAMEPDKGWRIEYVEIDAETVFRTDGKPLTVTGRIDRIDRHRDGRFRLLDYKTSEKGDAPDRTHRKSGQWIDLQLPLYRRLAESLKIAGPVELGYIVLPKKLEDVGYQKAPWGEAEVSTALGEAENVIRSIRNGVFWPPREASAWADEFSAICMEQYRGREDVLREVRESMGS